MTADILNPDQQAEGLVSSEVPAGVSLAGLPATLIVSGLEDQLSQAALGYTETDYLAPILEAQALLTARHEGDPDTLGEVRDSFSRILSRVAGAIAADWGADLVDLGVDPGGADYAGDVYELYRFFVVDRRRNAEALLYGMVTLERRRLADRYRRTVVKKDQTVAEARRTFASFDDVVVWVCMPELLEDMRAERGPVGTLVDALGVLNLDGTTLLKSVAWKHPDDTFMSRYAAPLLVDRQQASVATALRGRWLEEAPKKTAAGAAEDEE